MSKAAAEFIAKLSTDPDLLAKYKANPRQVMTEAGLSAEDQEVLESGDPERIRQHLGDDAPPGCFSLFI
jgi:hypothetical protein